MKWALTVGGIGVVAVSILYSVLTFNSIFECGVEDLAVDPSPDGGNIASVFRRDCGATTGLVTGVSMRSANGLFGGSKSDEILIIKGEEVPKTHWLSGTSLQVVIPTTADVFSKRYQWHGVEITFSFASDSSNQ